MKNTIAIISVFIISVLLFGLTIKGIAGNPDIDTVKAKYEGTTNPLELSPERGRFGHVMALAEDNKYELNKKLGDLAFPDVGVHNGKFFSYFAPGISYMATPFYILGSKFELAQVATFSFISIMTILAMIFIFKIAREIMELPIWASVLAPIIFGFSTTAWSYAGTLYQHNLSVFFILSGFYAAWRYQKNTSGSWAWGLMVWANYALSITIDYPNAILMLPVMIYFFISSISLKNEMETFKINFRISFVATMIAFVLITGAHLYHNDHYFGDWLKLSGELVGYKTMIDNNLDPLDPKSEVIVETTIRVKNASTFFSESKLVRGFIILLFSTDRGLFLYSPILILGIIGLIMALRKNHDFNVFTLLSVILFNLFLYSSWGDPWGGWAYGPRYLIISMSVLSLFVPYFLVAIKDKVWPKLLTLILFIYSLAVALLGTLTTNAVPPKIEAVALKTDWNFMFNIPLISGNKTGSFVYKTYLYEYISLAGFYWSIFGFIFLIFIFLVFVMPKLEKNGD